MIDTIVALASGSLPSAIAVVRVSGPKIPELINTFTGKNHTDRVAHLCFFTSDEAVLDQVISTHYHAPHSFTGEHIWEIATHGGKAIVSAILDALTAVDGVVAAEPGAFTRRAVENGKLDLLQAEAIADLVAAESPKQQALALGHLDGKFSEVCTEWFQKLLWIQASLDALIDFPDEDDVSVSMQSVQQGLADMDAVFGRALGAQNIGTRIRDGLVIAITGEPNVGKSSLFNALLQQDRSIITDIPGTTRDYIEAKMVVAGQAVTLVDTAGLRATEDQIEKLGIQRAKALSDAAHLRIIVRDATRLYDISDNRPDAYNLVVANKVDLLESVDHVSRETHLLSVETGVGLDEFRDALTQAISALTSTTEPILISRKRHKQCIESSRSSIRAALLLVDENAPPEIISEDVRAASSDLERLIGRIDSEDVLGHIFSEFCIGK